MVGGGQHAPCVSPGRLVADYTDRRGHFNQRETPEAREALREEMEEKENARAKKAKKEMESYKEAREKWAKRLTNLKILSGIVLLGMCEWTPSPDRGAERSPPQSRGAVSCRTDILRSRY